MSSYTRTIQKRIFERKGVSQVPLWGRRKGKMKVVGPIWPLFPGQLARNEDGTKHSS